MRTILFRGKRVDNGVWVIGSLIDREYILQYIDLVQSWDPIEKDYKVTCRADAVIPATIGQFTGLTDKNGDEIYEGDIVECSYGTGIVVFLLGAFMVQWLDDTEANMEMAGMNNTFRRQREDGEQFKVIGNIHDNPELVNATGATTGITDMKDPNELKKEDQAYERAEDKAAEKKEDEEAKQIAEAAEEGEEETVAMAD